MFSDRVGAANLKFSLDYQQAIRELKKQIGSIVVRCSADGVLHSSKTDYLVYEACTISISRLSDQKLTYDLEALNKAGKTISEYLKWLDQRQDELLQDFGRFVEQIVKDKPYLANVHGMVQEELHRIFSRASTKGHVAALEQVTDHGHKLTTQHKTRAGEQKLKMKKKIQVFVSSTYLDMKEERQAAVQAILNAGHIPAGMELFAAGNESQWETIKQWIDESDAFMLILGGRYGSLEPDSQKSYIELEYRYAMDTGKPLFSVVASEIALEGKTVETENIDKYKAFKDLVLSKICRHFDDPKDIKEAVHQTLSTFIEKYEFHGWISGKEATLQDVHAENARLKEELSALNSEVEKLKAREESGDRSDFDKLVTILKSEIIQDEGGVLKAAIGQTAESLYNLLMRFQGLYIDGIQDDASNKLEWFLYTKTGAKLRLYELVSRADLAGSFYHRIKLTRYGREFIRREEFKRAEKEVPI